jgi:hypothetical protein
MQLSYHVLDHLSPPPNLGVKLKSYIISFFVYLEKLEVKVFCFCSWRLNVIVFIFGGRKFVIYVL